MNGQNIHGGFSEKKRKEKKCMECIDLSEKKFSLFIKY